MLQNKKAVILTLSLLFLVLMVGVYIDNVSDLYFSDGIPVLIRLERFYNGQFDVFSYVFSKHGNSVHASIYLLAWINDVFFNGTMGFLKWCSFLSIVGLALMANWIMYRKTLSVSENLIVFIIADIIIAGTYNCELYLPFQNCLTLTRFCCVLLLWKMAGCLSEEKKKHWILWLVLSSVVSLLHGVGMMFVLGIFYVHIATKQSLKKCIGALLPFGIYAWVQWNPTGNYGETVASLHRLLPCFGELLLSILSFYGGFCHILFGWSKDVCVGIGALSFTATFITLLYFLIVPYAKIKWLPQIPLKNRKAVFAMGLLGISFLCSIGSAVYVVSRKDSPSYDAVRTILGTGRYLCYGVTPYVILLYLSTGSLKRQILRRTLFLMYLFLTLVLIHKNDKVTERIGTAFNSILDREAIALLSGVNLDSGEIKKGYSNWAYEPFYALYIPKTYQRLQESNRYIWHNQPVLGAKILNPTIRDMIQATDVSLSETSDPQYLFVQFSLPTSISKRYIPLANEKYAVVGFAHEVPHRYFSSGKRKLYFRRMYTYEGYVKKPEENVYFAVTGENISYRPALQISREKDVPLSVNFADQTLPFEVSGLSYAEKWGRWTDGDTVRFRFNFSQDKPIKLSFKGVHARVDPNNPAVTGTVYANGVKMATWKFQYKMPIPKTEFIIPADVLNIRHPLELKIKLDGVHGDRRRLGLGFRSLFITPAEPVCVQSVSLPQRHDFSDKTLPFLVSGLSHAEKWGRWTDGDTVLFRFDLPQDKSIKLDFKGMHALVYPNNPAVTGTVFANGVKVATWTFQYKKPSPKTEFVIPSNVLKIKKPLDIEIKIDGAKAPIDLGVNKDKRRLGIGFRSLIISPAS